MKIGIIGAGTVGGTLARQWARAGHQVMLSFSRHPERLQQLADEIGTQAKSGTPAQASQFAEVIVFAPNFWMAEEAIHQMEHVEGKTVIDTTNPYRWGNVETLSGGLVRMLPEQESAAEWLARKLPQAQIAKAFSSLQPRALLASAARIEADRVAVPFATNHAQSRDYTTTLVKAAGGLPFDIGALSNAKLIEMPGRLSRADDLTLPEAARRLAAHS
jgi:8-hydroxy-5-deazaflavin:NADPH oxidoreductase